MNYYTELPHLRVNKLAFPAFFLCFISPLSQPLWKKRVWIWLFLPLALSQKGSGWQWHTTGHTLLKCGIHICITFMRQLYSYSRSKLSDANIHTVSLSVYVCISLSATKNQKELKNCQGCAGHCRLCWHYIFTRSQNSISYKYHKL